LNRLAGDATTPDGRLSEEKGLPFPPNSGYMFGSSERLNF